MLALIIIRLSPPKMNCTPCAPAVSIGFWQAPGSETFAAGAVSTLPAPSTGVPARTLPETFQTLLDPLAIALWYSGSPLPESLWKSLQNSLIAETEALTVGAVDDFTNFTSAVIDERSFGRLKAAIDRAHATDSIKVLAGGTYDDSVGYFVRPTLLAGTDPRDEIFCNEYFGPILSLHVYPDASFDRVLTEVDQASPYALTGSIIARDRAAVAQAGDALRFTAGNFYINDKPTGAVVGQQPFGGARASGTNDKAGSAANLARWTSPRSIKETFVAPTSVGYPHQA